MNGLIDDLQSIAIERWNEENGLANQIEQLLEQRQQTSVTLDKSHVSINQYVDTHLLIDDVKQLKGRLTLAAQLAGNVSATVRRIDDARTKVIACLSRVDDVLELKHAATHVRDALQAMEFERAAGHVQRFRSIDLQAIRDSASQLPDETGLSTSSLDEACTCLQQAAEDLKRVVAERFEMAVSKHDHQQVFRFARLFPLLGEHQSGLSRFGNYLRNKLDKQLAEQANANTAGANIGKERCAGKWVSQLTQLFECIASILNQVQTFVQTDFGYGYLIHCVLVLQNECDHRIKRILDDFEKTKDVTNLSMNARKQLKQSLPEAAVIALNESHTSNTNANGANVSSASTYVTSITSSGNCNNANGNKSFEPLELDAVLDDIGQIRTRSNRYLRFVCAMLMDDFRSAKRHNRQAMGPQTIDQVKQVLHDNELIKRLHQFNDLHVLLEACYLRGCVLKALQLDRPISETRTSSALEDAFFVANVSTRRAWDGQSVDVLCACINHTAHALDQGFWHALHERLAGGYPAANSMLATALDLRQSYGVWQSGRIRSGGSSDLERSRRAFQTAINNLSCAGTYCGKLRRTLASLVRNELPDNLLNSLLTILKDKDETNVVKVTDVVVDGDHGDHGNDDDHVVHDDHVDQIDHADHDEQIISNSQLDLFKSQQFEKLDSCLQQLDTLADKCERSASTGLQQLTTAVLASKLRSWCNSLASEAHVLDETQLSQYEVQDGLRSCTASFLIALDGTLGTLQQGLSEENFAILLNQFTCDLTKRVETVIRRCTFNKLGGLQLDRELRSVMSYLSSTCSKWSIRDRFVRIKQMVALLALDHWPEAQQLREEAAALSDADIRHVLRLRIDWSQEDMKRMQL